MGDRIGTVSVKLKGCGELTLDFGNCCAKDIVSVYLDDRRVLLASANANKIVKNLRFTPGQTLRLEEEWKIQCIEIF